MLPFVADRGNDTALAREARGLALRWPKDSEAVPADVRAELLYTAAHTADREADPLFAHYVAVAKVARFARERRDLIRALGGFRDPALARRAAELTLGGPFDANEALLILEGQLENDATRPTTLAWLDRNYEALFARDNFDALPGWASGGCSAGEKELFIAAFAKRMQDVDGGPRSYAKALERIELASPIAPSRSRRCPDGSPRKRSAGNRCSWFFARGYRIGQPRSRGTSRTRDNRDRRGTPTPVGRPVAGLPMQDRISNTTPGWRGYAVRTGAALLALLAIAYAGAGWYLWANQRELIYLPTRDVRQTPAAVGLEYEEVWVPIPSGQPAVLNGWWLRSGDAAAPTFLYLHGNDFNLGANVEHVARLNRLGYAVLAVDYRGYGKSVGAFPSETQLYEDAEAAWSYLVRERGVDPGRAIIYGHSLGGAVAIELALRHPEAAGLIAESAFTSMPEMAKFVYGMFPVDWLLNQRFDALAKVPMLRVPVLFIHGTADAEVPYAMSEHLFAAAAGSKWLTLVPGGGHEDSAKVGGSLYADAVRDFARRALAAR